MPPEFASLMIPFRPLFSKSVYQRALVLLSGAILAVGSRTVAAVLHVVGRADSSSFGTYHRVLSRAHWSAREAARLLLIALVEAFVPEGPLVVGLDDTIERRRGARIAAKGIYRDPVRSSKGHFVKTSGLRWLSVMLICRIRWTERLWALPFLTVLSPSQRYHKGRGRRHKKLTDYARQSLKQLRRWLPERYIVVVCDTSFSAIEFLASVKDYVVVVTRLRLDAALYEPAPPRQPGQVGRPRRKGERLPSLKEVLADPKTTWQRLKLKQWYGQQTYELEVATGTAVWYHGGMPTVPIRWMLTRDPAGKLAPKAFLCTDLARNPLDILSWFVRRWQVEVTFEEVRRHLGVETQRQWSEKAIERTTPCLLGLFSLVTLMADELAREGKLCVRSSRWYRKEAPTFSDALAAVRIVLWREQHLLISAPQTETLKIPKAFFERLTGTLAYAA